MPPCWCRETLFQELFISTAELREMSEYHFDGKGKAFRPIIVVLMARACNIHHNNSRWVTYVLSCVFYSANLPSRGCRLLSWYLCLRTHLWWVISSFVFPRSPWSRVWASSFSTLFNIHGRATSAANKHFRKNFQSYIEFSHAEVKNASMYAYL